MKKNSKINGLKSRDRIYTIVSYIALFLPVIIFVQKYVVHCLDATIDSYDMLNAYSDICIPLTTAIVLLLQFGKWEIFESGALLNMNSALPVAKKESAKYDLATGVWQIVITNAAYAVSILCGEAFLCHAWKKGYTEEVLAEVYERVHLGYDEIMAEINKEILHECGHVLWAALDGVMVALLLYVILMLSRAVAANMLGVVLFFAAGWLAETVAGIFLSGAYWNVSQKLFSGNQNLGTVREIMTKCLTVLLIAAGIYVMFVCVKKRDEAKHGLFFFAWARFLTTFTLGAICFYAVSTYAWTTGVNAVGKAILILLGILFGGGVFALTFHMFGPKRYQQ